MVSFYHFLGLISSDLQVANGEHMIAVFSVASLFPQKRKFFLDKVSGLSAFIARLSKLLDNGISAIRLVACSRRNYLFCQNDNTAESTNIIYSFMGCCHATNVDFRIWMIYFLDHVHEYDEDYTKDIAELLPSNLDWHLLHHI